MAVQISAKPDAGDVDRVSRFLAEKSNRAPTIVSRALNKTATWVRTRVVRAVAAEIALKQKIVRESVTVSKASYKRLEANVNVKGKRVPVIDFGARQTKKGVGYRVSKKEGRKTVPGAFISTMKSGHKGVFIREEAKGAKGLIGSVADVLMNRRSVRSVRRLRRAKAAGVDRVGRLPIREFFGPSIPGVVQKAPGLIQGLLKDAEERTQMEMSRQIEVLMGQMAKTSSEAG